MERDIERNNNSIGPTYEQHIIIYIGLEQKVNKFKCYVDRSMSKRCRRAVDQVKREFAPRRESGPPSTPHRDAPIENNFPY